MVGMGGEKLSKFRVRSRVDPLRRSHCRYRPGFATDRVSHGALRPQLPSSGMDHRQQRFLAREPDPHPPRNRPDPRVDRLASHSGPPHECRRGSRDHITRDDLAQVNLPRQEATLLWTAAAPGCLPAQCTIPRPESLICGALRPQGGPEAGWRSTETAHRCPADTPVHRLTFSSRLTRASRNPLTVGCDHGSSVVRCVISGSARSTRSVRMSCRPGLSGMHQRDATTRRTAQPTSDLTGRTCSTSCPPASLWSRSREKSLMMWPRSKPSPLAWPRQIPIDDPGLSDPSTHSPDREPRASGSLGRRRFGKSPV
jgi:hypothetical protein